MGTKDTIKRGRFQIPRETLKEAPDVVMAIMGRCMIVRCEFMFHKNLFEYEAESPDFDDVPDMAESPYYDIEVDENGDITWKKQEG